MSTMKSYHLHSRVALLRGFVGVVAMAACLSTASAQAGEHMFGPTGIYGTLDKLSIRVARVEGPAKGKITPGMVIVGAGGANFKEHVRRELADAIDVAESEKGAGKLTLILAGGKKVDLTLTVLGTYSDTAPYNCPKCAAILKRAKFTPCRPLFTRLAAMAIQDVTPVGLSPEELAALKAKRPDTAAVPRDPNSNRWTWDWSYGLIADCEQYLRKPDEALFARIRESAIRLAEGQDAGGLWGHRIATPERNGRLPGYAQINQPSLTIFIGLLLARECGVDDKPLLDGIERTYAFYASFIGRGALNYGVHGPNTRIFNNNGTSATAAIAMALYGDKEGAQFFAKLSAASYKGLEVGHGGYIFNVFWTPLGAAVGGPELASGFFKKARWLYTMYRGWDGRFSFMAGKGKNFKGSSLVIPYALGNRSLRITGRGADKSIWLKGKDATEAVEMGNYDAEYGKMSTDELAALLNHPIPQVRRGAGWTIKDRKDAPISMFVKLMKEGSTLEKRMAIGRFNYPCPKDISVARLDDIGAILRDENEDIWVRVSAASALVWAGEPAQEYYMDMVRLLAAERPWDRFGDVEWELAPCITRLCKTPFTDGLVTDKEVFYKAALKLADNKRQHLRGQGTQMLADMPKEDFPLVADKMMHLAKNNDRTYHSYHSPGLYVGGAIKVLAKANVAEGIPLALGMLDEPSGKWSFKLDAVLKALLEYGPGAKEAVEKLRADPRLKALEQDKNRFGVAFRVLVKAVEEGKGQRKLVPFEEAKKGSE